MAGKKAPGGKASSAKIDAVRHKDKRKNMPTEELRDFVRQDDGRGRDDRLNLIVEVTGQKNGKVGEKRAAKAATARNLRVPAVNNAGTWGRWAFIEISDPWDAKSAISTYLRNRGADHE